MDQTNPDSPWYPHIWVDPERMGGEPCFRGTRLPVRILFEYLGGGYTLEDFLDDFENVTRETLAAVLALSAREIERTARAA